MVAKLRAVGVLANAEGSKPQMVRLVTHLDVSAADITEALPRIEKALGWAMAARRWLQAQPFALVELGGLERGQALELEE